MSTRPFWENSIGNGFWESASGHEPASVIETRVAHSTFVCEKLPVARCASGANFRFCNRLSQNEDYALQAGDMVCRGFDSSRPYSLQLVSPGQPAVRSARPTPRPRTRSCQKMREQAYGSLPLVGFRCRSGRQALPSLSPIPAIDRKEQATARGWWLDANGTGRVTSLDRP